MTAQPYQQPPEPIITVLNRLQGLRRSGDGWSARCPAHDDRHASLSVRVGDENKALLYCHTGCSLSLILGALNLNESDLFAEERRTEANHATTWYEIRDTQNTLIAYHRRDDEEDGKHFSWWRPNKQKGLGGLKTALLPLYGSQYQATWGDEVVVCEGEKAADSLMSIGIHAVGTVTGAGNPIPSQQPLEVLRGKEAVLWADNDDGGRDHMQQVAASLRRVAAHIRFVAWPDAKPKDDAANCLARRGPEEVRRLIAEAAAVVGEGGRSFSSDLEIHVASFPATATRIEFDLIRTDSRGETSAEITIFMGANEEPLHKSRLNLLSTQSKAVLANALKRRTAPADLAWDEMVEWSAMQALTTHRRGSQPILLSQAPDPPHNREVLGDLVSPSGVTILFGDGGSGKSQMLQAIALSIHTNANLLGIEPISQMNVLYLDWEDEAWVHRDRMERLLGHSADVPYLRMSRALPHSIDQLRGVIREFRTEIVFVDSLAPASGGDANEQSTADEFFSATRRLQVPVVCSAHNTKAADDQKPFGSAFFHDLARRTWFVKNTQEPGSSEMTVGLYSRKNNLGQRFRDCAFRVSFADNRIAIGRTDIAGVPQLNDRMPLRARIKDLLSDGAMLAYEIADELGYGTRSGIQTIRNVLNSGEGKDFVKFAAVDGTGTNRYRWGLARKNDASN